MLFTFPSYTKLIQRARELEPRNEEKHGILKRLLNLESTEICSLLIQWLYDASAVHFLIYEMGLKFKKTPHQGSNVIIKYETL